MNFSPVARNARIGVIGAGPAGLTVAWLLKRKGYANVVVFEGSSRVGGKSFSRDLVHLDGTVDTVDLGTQVVMRGKVLDQLVRAAGLGRSDLVDFADARYAEPGEAPKWPLSLSRGWPRGLSHYLVGMYMSRATRYPGFAGLHRLSHLSEPVSGWMRRQRLGYLEAAILPAATTWLFGPHADRIPVAYFFKLEWMRWRIPMWRNILFRGQSFRSGFSRMWEAIGKGLDIRVRHRVAAVVRRSERELSVRFDDGSAHELNHLVWTAPLDKTWKMLEPIAPGVSEFSKMRSLRRAVLTARVEGLPASAFWIRNDAHVQRSTGTPLAIVSRGDRGLYQFFPFVGETDTMGDMEMQVRALVRRFGGSVTEFACNGAVWHWHPYFPSDAFASGVYDRLEGLQGKGGLYLSGEALSGVTLPCVTDHAAHVAAMFDG